MATKKGRKKKHIPLRTCVACREVLAKRTLIRIVRTPEGVKIDPTGKVAGRGAYLHDLKDCWQKGLKGALAQSLKTELTSEELKMLESYCDKLENREE